MDYLHYGLELLPQMEYVKYYSLLCLAPFPDSYTKDI